MRLSIFKYSFNVIRRLTTTAYLRNEVPTKKIFHKIDVKDFMELPKTTVSIPKYQSKPKEPLLPSEKEQLRLQDIKDNLLSALDDKTVFEIYLKNEKSYELVHYLFTTRRLSQHVKNGLISSDDVQNNTVFKQLVNQIWKKISLMEETLVLNFYKSFLDMRVSSSSLIMQSLLQMMRHQINILNLKDLIFLHRLLVHTGPCNLKTALQFAVPSAVENLIQRHFPIKLKYNEISQLLNICIMENVPSLNRVVRHIHETVVPKVYASEKSPVSLNVSVSILYNLFDIFLIEELPLQNEDLGMAHDLLNNILDHLVANELNGINQRWINMILVKMSKTLDKRRVENEVYENFLLKLTEKVIKENWGVKALSYIVDLQFRLCFVSDDLLNHLLLNDKRFNDLMSSEIKVLPLLSALGASNIKRENLEKIVHRLVDKVTFDYENLKIPWIRMALNFISLNCFPEVFFSSVVNEHFLERYLKTRQNASRDNLDLIRLDKALKKLSPDGSWAVPDGLVSMAKNKISLPPLPYIHDVLPNIVGDGQCVASGVVTDDDNIIDHLIVLNKENKMVKLCPSGSSSEKHHIRDFKNINNMKRLAIIEIPKSWCCRPGLKIRGYFKVQLQLIENEGFEILQIHQGELEALRPEETGVYIKGKLREMGVNFD